MPHAVPGIATGYLPISELLMRSYGPRAVQIESAVVRDMAERGFFVQTVRLGGLNVAFTNTREFDRYCVEVIAPSARMLKPIPNVPAAAPEAAGAANAGEVSR